MMDVELATKTATFAIMKSVPQVAEIQTLGSVPNKMLTTVTHQRKDIDFVCVENRENDSLTINRLLANNPQVTH